ncbi:hypothetical protein [Corallococcus exiguus]|nr:hypothetical protein [Corallococcus exiguus]
MGQAADGNCADLAFIAGPQQEVTKFQVLVMRLRSLISSFPV